MNFARRVVVDTGVLVSAAIRPESIPALALEKALLLFEVCASAETLAELDTVLLREKFDRYAPRAERVAFIAGLRERVTVVAVTQVVTDCPDPKDNMFLALGFASGLPLALTGQAMQAWLTVDGVDLATIGFFGLVGIPYTFKFLWAPLMDRFEPPWLGRRRGWLALTQLALAALLWWMASLSPRTTPGLFAGAAVLVAFLSASQDVVVDAYRTDLLAPRPSAAWAPRCMCSPTAWR
jgi:putative PIN family toxin of toxin-antitoxin system